MFHLSLFKVTATGNYLPFFVVCEYLDFNERPMSVWYSCLSSSDNHLACKVSVALIIREKVPVPPNVLALAAVRDRLLR